MKITIVGAGAIGGVIGAYLVKGGQDVTFVDIAVDHVKKMNEQGLTIKGTETFTVPVKAYTAAEFVKRDEELELVFLCVKAQHTRDAVRSFKHMLTKNSMVVSFQNGLCEQEIADEIGEEQTIGCFVNLFADYLESGTISYGGIGSVYIGELHGEISPRVEKIVSILASWGNARATDNLSGYIWGKLSYGAILTATALTNETIADVLDNRQNRAMLMDLASEILEVAKEKKIKPMGFDDWEPGLAFPPEARNWDELHAQLDKLVSRLRTYSKTRSGIWRDLAVRKRKTEVPSHLTPIIAEGKSYGIDMRLTEATLSMIIEIEEGKRELSIENLELLHSIHEANLARN
ncbi:2-dehydropantoate 2-reductase [Fictibacillus sp. WQ 8-8]|uniref:ketopantoate reductase family protein n=1 Tax=Fictibacillus sp. WQ 8-8 TaxID=2938788 RepID=UPI00210D2EB3|nr:2-dehydropantoate 2-reductase [Fictibacillus sp. WQ 8-8]MCQ6268365.1 2-dehydropantoate 2-reductase [Fictibacillus sp. WQ 8-8]